MTKTFTYLTVLIFSSLFSCGKKSMKETFYLSNDTKDTITLYISNRLQKTESTQKIKPNELLKLHSAIINDNKTLPLTSILNGDSITLFKNSVLFSIHKSDDKDSLPNLFNILSYKKEIIQNEKNNEEVYTYIF